MEDPKAAHVLRSLFLCPDPSYSHNGHARQQAPEALNRWNRLVLKVTDWADIAADELDRFQGDHANKKRSTVIALVDARMAGKAEETVWNLPTTCSRNTWHTKWKHDLLFQDVLANVERLARRWTDTRTIRALQEASEKLMLASPAAAGKAIALMLSTDDAVALRAAFGVLDRAGVETAPKQQQQHGLTPELESLIERVYGQPEDVSEE